MGIFCLGKNTKPSQALFLLFSPIHPLTSNNSYSFEARDLKVWIQTASSLANNADRADRTSAILLFLTSNISGTSQNIKKLVNKFCPIDMRIISANF